MNEKDNQQYTVSGVVSIKMMNKSDQDIMDHLSTRPTATTMKAALREYMKNHPEKEN